MKKRLRYKFFLLLCCFTWLNNHAQQSFHNKASLDSVHNSGFYQINLSPLLSAMLQQNMRDLRIIDSAGKQTPYILKSDLPAFNENKFSGLPIISAQSEVDAQTHIVIENTSQQPLDELLLVIKNTDADRLVTLSGSEDDKKWFVIKEHIYLNSYFSNNTDRFVQTLKFPKSSYRYFKIIINGKDVLPVNIIKAGVYERSEKTGKYVAIPAPALIQKDSSDKHSYISVQFHDYYFIDRLLLQVKGPKFYKRTVEIYDDAIGSETLQGNFTISSDKEAVLAVSVKSNKLLIKISNDDNPALKVDSVGAFQLNKYLLAYLERGNSYQLLFSDSSAVAPVYDLEAFKDSIAANPATLQYGAIEKNTMPEKKLPPKKASNKILIWTAIAIAIFTLLYLSYKLTNDIKKSN